MTVLALRLAGPMQSWGAQSRFTRRDTQDAPTKSGVLGLLAAARGLRRTDPIEDLLSLRFGVRKDQPGELLRDFHTAHKLSGSSMPLSQRYYLSDAVFLVGLEGEAELLEGLNEALLHPVFPLYLGRRSCPPTGPVTLGIVGGSLEEFFARWPWQASKSWQRGRVHGGETVSLEVLVDRGPDAAPGAQGGQGGSGGAPVPHEAYTLRDVPESWDPVRRMYGWRTVYRMHVDVDVPPELRGPSDPQSPSGTGPSSTGPAGGSGGRGAASGTAPHNPFAALGG